MTETKWNLDKKLLVLRFKPGTNDEYEVDARKCSIGSCRLPQNRQPGSAMPTLANSFDYSEEHLRYNQRCAALGPTSGQLM
jgi:hypothetical protein